MAETPYYLHQGVKVPRVSRILSILREPQVEKWAAKTPDAEEQSADARRLGKQVHAYIAADLQEQSFKLKAPTSQLMNAITAYQAWKREHADLLTLPRRIEHPFTLPQYGGTVDLVLGEYLVIDWKITGAIRPKHWIQVNAYIPLIWENQLSQRQVQIVRLDKDLGIYEAPEPRGFSQRIQTTFDALRDVYVAWYAETDYKEKEAV